MILPAAPACVPGSVNKNGTRTRVMLPRPVDCTRVPIFRTGAASSVDSAEARASAVTGLGVLCAALRVWHRCARRHQTLSRGFAPLFFRSAPLAALSHGLFPISAFNVRIEILGRFLLTFVILSLGFLGRGGPAGSNHDHRGRVGAGLVLDGLVSQLANRTRAGIGPERIRESVFYRGIRSRIRALLVNCPELGRLAGTQLHLRSRVLIDDLNSSHIVSWVSMARAISHIRKRSQPFSSRGPYFSSYQRSFSL